MPTETQESIAFWNWLKDRNILAFHVPNELIRKGRDGKIAQMSGLLTGVSDFIILHKAPLRSDVRCIAIEMKRRDHSNDASDPQLDFGRRVIEEGGIFFVAYGAAEAIQQMKALGFQ